MLRNGDDNSAPNTSRDMSSGSPTIAALEQTPKAPAARPPTAQTTTDTQYDPAEPLVAGDTFHKDQLKNKVHTVLPIKTCG